MTSGGMLRHALILFCAIFARTASAADSMPPKGYAADAVSAWVGDAQFLGVDFVNQSCSILGVPATTDRAWQTGRPVPWRGSFFGIPSDFKRGVSLMYASTAVDELSTRTWFFAIPSVNALNAPVDAQILAEAIFQYCSPSKAGYDALLGFTVGLAPWQRRAFVRFGLEWMGWARTQEPSWATERHAVRMRPPSAAEQAAGDCAGLGPCSEFVSDLVGVK